MTEKRFIIDEYFEIGSVIIDTENENVRFKHENELSMKQCCDLLNELYEENQDLKSFNKDLAENLSVCANAQISKDNRIEKLEEKIQRERTSFTKTHERWSKEAENKIKELSEENEQLRTKNNAYIQDIEVFKEENTHLKLENEQLKEEIKKLHTKIFEMRTNIALERTEISRQTYTGKKNEKEYLDAKEFLDEIEKW